METALSFQDALLQRVTNDFRRFLHDDIYWGCQMTGIKGPRGAGKTTLLLQHLKFDLGDQAGKALYINADHTWLSNKSLLDTALEWDRHGGEVLLIDEIHKYPTWSTELKNIYDGIPQLKVIFSAPSALNIYRGQADLSRRVISYTLPGLSFREYLEFTHDLTFPVVSLEEIRSRHRQISYEIISKIRPIPLFNRYLKNGYWPFSTECESEYLLKLAENLSAVLDIDLACIASYNAGTAIQVKKLLSFLIESAPYKPNISGLSGAMGISRDRILELIYQLRDARLLNVLAEEGKDFSRLRKPDKIFLENPNLAYTISTRPDRGNLRRTFLLGQLLNAGFDVFQPQSGDFLVDGTTIEAGGRNNTARLVKGEGSYLLATDDIESGFGNKIPLWLFGFLY